MRPSQLKELIAARFRAGIKRPIHVESSPGIGKTQIAAQAAKELGIEFRAIHAPLMQPEDYGFPVISNDKTTVDFIVSKAKFPVEGSECADSGILLIDELSQSDNSTQKIIANLLQEREIHGQKLKAGWVIITTGNRMTDRAGANRILSHLKNRITTVELEASLDDWTAWALENQVKSEVIAFIRFRPDLLNSFDAQSEVNATPRSWVEGVSASLGAVDSTLELEVFKGDIGEGPAAEFCGFLKIYRKLPNPDAILLNPTTAEIPNDPATLYALVGALAHKTTAQNFNRAMTYVGRMAPEFTVLYVRDAIRRKPEIQATKEFIQWASGDGAKLLS